MQKSIRNQETKLVQMKPKSQYQFSLKIVYTLFKGPFYQTALNDVGSYYTIKTRPIEDDSFWQMVHVDSKSDKEKFIPENPQKYVASGLSVMKISNDETNLFYEYAAPKAGIHLPPRVIVQFGYRY